MYLLGNPFLRGLADALPRQGEHNDWPLPTIVSLRCQPLCFTPLFDTSYILYLGHDSVRRAALSYFFWSGYVKELLRPGNSQPISCTPIMAFLVRGRVKAEPNHRPLTSTLVSRDTLAVNTKNGSFLGVSSPRALHWKHNITLGLLSYSHFALLWQASTCSFQPLVTTLVQVSGAGLVIRLRVWQNSPSCINPSCAITLLPRRLPGARRWHGWDAWHI